MFQKIQMLFYLILLLVLACALVTVYFDLQVFFLIFYFSLHRINILSFIDTRVFSSYKEDTKELSLCQKLIFFKSFIFAT